MMALTCPRRSSSLQSGSTWSGPRSTALVRACRTWETLASSTQPYSVSPTPLHLPTTCWHVSTPKRVSWCFIVVHCTKRSSYVIVQSCNNYHINLGNFGSIYELLSCLIHVLLINALSICSFYRSRAGVLYDVHHAKSHHSGFCQLWECYKAHWCAQWAQK